MPGQAFYGESGSRCECEYNDAEKKFMDAGAGGDCAAEEIARLGNLASGEECKGKKYYGS